jgi:hypothetical protein
MVEIDANLNIYTLENGFRITLMAVWFQPACSVLCIRINYYSVLGPIPNKQLFITDKKYTEKCQNMTLLEWQRKVLWDSVLILV